MPPDEIRAVFAHEVAHGTRRHLVWFLLLFVGVMFVSYVAARLPVGERTDPAASPAPTRPRRRSPPSCGGCCSGRCSSVSSAGSSPSSRSRGGSRSRPTSSASESHRRRRALQSRASCASAAIAGKPIDRHGLRHFSIGLADRDRPRLRGRPRRARAAGCGSIRAPKIAIAALVVLVAAGVAWKAAPRSRAGPREARSDRRRVRASPQRAAAQVGRRTRARPRCRIASVKNDAGRDRHRRADGPRRTSCCGAAGRATSTRRARSPRDLEANWPAGDLDRRFQPEAAQARARRDRSRPRPRERFVRGVKAAQDRLQDLLTVYPRNPSVDVCEQELRFLAAAAGRRGRRPSITTRRASSRRGCSRSRAARSSAAPSRARRSGRSQTWPDDAAWRRVVLERALGGRKPRRDRRRPRRRRDTKERRDEPSGPPPGAADRRRLPRAHEVLRAGADAEPASARLVDEAERLQGRRVRPEGRPRAVPAVRAQPVHGRARSSPRPSHAGRSGRPLADLARCSTSPTASPP